MNTAPTLEAQFAALTDPRDTDHCAHKLLDIVTIAILAIVCGADSWTTIAAYGEAKETWLRQFLELPHGIPAHDTFRRVFMLLDAQEFEQCFLNWITAVQQVTTGQVIAVDGKCLRGTQDQYLGQQAIYLVSAWAAGDQVVLGQRKVAEKSNEITAIPELLKVLDVHGCIVSIDAMGCQKTIAQQITQQGGDYLLALKDNQPHLAEDVQHLFEWAAESNFAQMQHDTWTQASKGHGRIEIRTCTTISDPECLAMLAKTERWQGLRTVVQVRATRKMGDRVTTAVRYYLCSLAGDTPKLAKQVLAASRSHWGIENRLHWVLDVTLREDQCRARRGNSGENLAVLRHFALNLLRREKTSHLSVRAKRLRAGWDNRFLLKILSSWDA